MKSGMHLRFLKVLLTFIIILPGCFQNNADDEYDRVVKFNDEWKFSIGDDNKWADPDYNDADWENILVPSPWEDEGYHGYDGFGWYRQKFEIPGKLRGKSLYVFLGSVDDVDEVFINGHLIGFTGSFPPMYETAYTSVRRYPIPPDIINYDAQNTIAVRVYDAQLGGGITGGEVGIYKMNNMLDPDINLIGDWKFRTGDKTAYKEINLSDSAWSNVIVPGFWESQGFYDYDGYAWYRKEFNVPAEFAGKKLILLLGRVDDYDAAYVNGERVGSTWGRQESYDPGGLEDKYLVQRNYFLRDGLIRPGKNLIAVRVFDGFKDGGIYKGPIGLITQDKFRRYWKEQK